MSGLSVSRIADVTVTLSALAARGRNFGSMLILGASTVIPAAERLRLYDGAEAIAEDFGAQSEEYQAAVIWFAQRPQPAQLWVGRWVKTLSTDEQGKVETLAEALSALLENSSWYGLHLAVGDEPAATDLLQVAAVLEAAAPARLLAYTTGDKAVMDASSTTDVAALMKAAGYGRTFGQYASGSRYAALSAFARAFTVNFSGSNTTLTLKFKQEPGVTYETLNTTQANALEGKNLNVYLLYDNDTAILEQGVMANGDFFDERHGLDWLQNAVQTADYNTLRSAPTKIAQTDAGTTARMANLEQVLQHGVSNGLFAPGKWTGGPIGQLSSGDTLTRGYYLWADSVENQDQADRSRRIGVPIHIAAKLAGAIHYASVAITVVR